MHKNGLPRKSGRPFYPIFLHLDRQYGTLKQYIFSKEHK